MRTPKLKEKIIEQRHALSAQARVLRELQIPGIEHFLGRVLELERLQVEYDKRPIKHVCPWHAAACITCMICRSGHE